MTLEHGKEYIVVGEIFGNDGYADVGQKVTAINTPVGWYARNEAKGNYGTYEGLFLWSEEHKLLQPIEEESQ